MRVRATRRHRPPPWRHRSTSGGSPQRATSGLAWGHIGRHRRRIPLPPCRATSPEPSATSLAMRGAGCDIQRRRLGPRRHRTGPQRHPHDISAAHTNIGRHRVRGWQRAGRHRSWSQTMSGHIACDLGSPPRDIGTGPRTGRATSPAKYRYRTGDVCPCLGPHRSISPTMCVKVVVMSPSV